MSFQWSAWTGRPPGVSVATPVPAPHAQVSILLVCWFVCLLYTFWLVVFLRVLSSVFPLLGYVFGWLPVLCALYRLCLVEMFCNFPLFLYRLWIFNPSGCVVPMCYFVLLLVFSPHFLIFILLCCRCVRRVGACVWFCNMFSFWTFLGEYYFLDLVRDLR